MVLEVKRKDREATPSLLSRFKKGMQRSGILLRARKRRFHHRRKSVAAKRSAALRREELKKEFQRKRKFAKPQERI